MVMEVVQEDMGESNIQCVDHPYKNTTPLGGICAFCLQEKLGKLVSSSFPITNFPGSSSSSTTPSFRSGTATGSTSTTTTTTTTISSTTTTTTTLTVYPTRTRSRLPFSLTQRRKKKKDGVHCNTMNALKRSKSTTTPRRHGMHFLDHEQDLSNPQRKGFWSFLYPLSSKHVAIKKNETPFTPSRVVEENDQTPDRKVSRSRSVGCGSRSFSGDFFERISTGFGDCTLRRVESQREGKAKVDRNGHNGQDYIKQRVKCGGLFSGFMVNSSSSSSSSSSYWLSSSNEDHHQNVSNGKTAGSVGNLGHVHGRSKSWGWAFASPMRAFTIKPSHGKRGVENNNKPNLAAIPSLLSVRS